MCWRLVICSIFVVVFKECCGYSLKEIMRNVDLNKNIREVNK